MVYHWFPKEWWINNEEVNCTNSALTNFIKGTLSFQWQPLLEDQNVTTATGKVSSMHVLYNTQFRMDISYWNGVIEKKY